MPTTPYSLEPLEEDVSDKLQEKFQPEKRKEEESVAHESGEVRTEQEVHGGSVEDFLKETKAKIQAAPSSPVTQKVQNDIDAVSEEDESGRVSKLVVLAKAEGIAHAFEVALKLDDLYVVDRLHDTLSGKLYDELVQEGIISLEK